MPSPARARAVVLPIATLGELLVHGFEVHVWCPRCRTMRQTTIPAEKLRSRFAGAGVRCRCGAPGYPSFRPGPVAVCTYALKLDRIERAEQAGPRHLCRQRICRAPERDAVRQPPVAYVVRDIMVD
jgi:hypothetical protein